MAGEGWEGPKLAHRAGLCKRGHMLHPWAMACCGGHAGWQCTLWTQYGKDSRELASAQCSDRSGQGGATYSTWAS